MPKVKISPKQFTVLTQAADDLGKAKRLLNRALWGCGFCLSERGQDCSVTKPCAMCRLQAEIIEFLGEKGNVQP